MESFLKSILDKISPYDIFNNFFPGILFCSIIEKTTRFSFPTENILEKLFLYYFIGMIISRIGSILIERFLKWITITNKKTKQKENFIKFAPYSDYIEASKNDSFIITLSEKNNIYRTIIAMLIIILCVKLYDLFSYNLSTSLDNLVFFIILLLIIILFIYSYKKQTDYVRKRVEKYIQSKQNNQKEE